MDNIEENNLAVSESVKSSLDTMVYWCKFLAIVGYIMVGFMILFSIYLMFSGSSLYSNAGVDFGVGFMYLIMSVLYYFPVSYLYKFATNTRHALNSNSQSGLNNGLSNLASNFKFFGIMTVVVMSLYAFMFVISLFGFMMF